MKKNIAIAVLSLATVTALTYASIKAKEAKQNMSMAVTAQQAAQENAAEAHAQSALAMDAAARAEEARIVAEKALKDCKSK